MGWILWKIGGLRGQLKNRWAKTETEKTKIKTRKTNTEKTNQNTRQVVLEAGFSSVNLIFGS
jgi:hypothetical protein